MLKIKLFIIGLLGAAMLMTSCDDDTLGGGGIGGGADGPTINFLDNAGINTTTDSTVEPGEVFRIQVEVTAGEADLRDIEVFRDGFSLSAQNPSEFDILEVEDADEQNNAALIGVNASGITWTYEFIAPEEELGYNYSFTVTDVDGLETTNSINITVFQTVPDTPPTLTLNGNTNNEGPAGTLVSINVTAERGTNDLASISVWEDGVEIEDVSRIRFGGSDPSFTIETNPQPLFAPDTEGFSVPVVIRTISGDHNYVFRVTDIEGNNTDLEFTITESITGTALQNQFDFVLFSNASGPNLGGLDLDNGVAVPSASGDAEIRDLGIDTNQPAASNWIQRIEAVNGSELRVVNLANLPDGFTFDGITFKEQVTEAFNSGTSADPSPVLQVGDLLAVSSPTNIYIMRVDDIVVTDNDNEDFYSFSIKF